MTAFSKQIKVLATQEKVWEIVADLGAVERFHPGVSKSYYTSMYRSGKGAGRICELHPAGKVQETVTYWEIGKGYTLEVTPLEKAPPLKSFFVSLCLDDRNPEHLTVTFSVAYQTKLGVVGKLLNALMIRSQIEKSVVALLEGLKIHVEQGVEILDMGALQNLKAA